MSNLGRLRKSVLSGDRNVYENGVWVLNETTVTARDGTTYTKGQLDDVIKYWDMSDGGPKLRFKDAQEYIDHLLNRDPEGGVPVTTETPIYTTSHTTGYVSDNTIKNVRPTEYAAVIDGKMTALNITDGAPNLPGMNKAKNDLPPAKTEIPWIPISLGVAAVAAAFILG